MKTPPKFLYKCMGKRLDHIGDILVNRRLHFSNPANFNDPFDCALGLDLNREATDEEWVEYLIHVLEQEEPDSSPDYRRDKAKDNVGRGRHKDPEFVSKTQDRIRRGIKEVGQDQGILCLTSDPKNIMM